MIANEYGPTDWFIITFGAGIILTGILIAVVTLYVWISELHRERRWKREHPNEEYIDIPTRSGGVTGMS